MVGLENRTSILPTPKIPDKVPGVFGPDYSFADNVPLPGSIGVRDGNSIESVVAAAKGVAYYVDTIGFGESSSSLTSGMGLKPIGVNTFMQTGFTCSNGADMWIYNEGIPTGNALGKRLADGLKSAGMPPMKGIAPGILEDVETALDPKPIMAAMFGSSTPICTYARLPVGDQNNTFKNTSTGSFYVDNPETVYCSNGTKPNLDLGTCNGGIPMQGRWIRNSETAVADAVVATYCPDGYSIINHTDSDCLKPIAKMIVEGFRDDKRSLDLIKMITAVAGILFLVGSIHRCVKGK